VAGNVEFHCRPLRITERTLTYVLAVLAHI